MTAPNVWSIPSALAAAVVLGLLLYVARRPPPAVLRPSVLALLWGSLVFTLGDLLSLGTTSMTVERVSAALLYAGLCATVGSTWMLALRTAELHAVPFGFGRTRWALAPLLWLGLLFLTAITEPWHGRFATPVPGGVRSDYQELWYVFAATGYGLVAVSIGMLLRVAHRGRGPLARSHALTLAAAAAATLLGNVIYVASPGSLPFDTTSLGLCAGGALLIFGIYRRGLFALSPVPVTELLRQGSDGVILVDSAGRLIDRNPAAAAWLPESLVVGESVTLALAGRFTRAERPDQALDADAMERDLLAEEQLPGGRLYQRLGDQQLVRVESQPVRGRRGNVVCRVLRLRDETHLHRLTDAVGEQASTLTAILAATDEGILVHMGGEIRYSNPQFHAIWRTPPELRNATVSGSLLDAYLPMIENREDFERAVDRVQAEPTLVLRDDVTLLDGRTLERTTLPLVQEGIAVGRVWRVRDVTEQRRSEEALQSARRLESLGVMAGGIAHDFNNLLVSMMGNAGLALAELPDSSQARDYVSDVERAAERASELTRQLLAYAGKGRIELRPVDLSRIVREVAELLGVSISKRVTLHCQLQEDLPAVTADASQLRQVAMNLVLNAADAIGEDEGMVTLATTLEDLGEADGAELVGDGAFRPGRYVVLRVADTGAGMDADVRRRIFDPFFSTKFTGRGLGLAATLGIVRSHDGFLRVESEPGRGSRFSVVLPAGDAPAEAHAQEQPVAPWRADATILVVDDDAEVARVALRMLETAGFRVLVAGSGEEAIARYRERGVEIDAVFLDLNMPGLSGADTLRELRALRADVRVVVTSGYPEEEAAARLDGPGGFRFVQKPYRLETLLETLRDALGG